MQAVSTQAPPTALIFSSATREKKRALTITGCLGRTPLPSTLKIPAREQSITGALSVTLAYFSLVCSETRVHSLSRLMAGEQWFEMLGCTWKFLMPTVPVGHVSSKFPGLLLARGHFYTSCRSESSNIS